MPDNRSRKSEKYLMFNYFSGQLDDADTEKFSEIIRSDSSVARDVAEFAVFESALLRHGSRKTEENIDLKRKSRSLLVYVSLTAAAVLLVAVTVLFYGVYPSPEISKSIVAEGGLRRGGEFEATGKGASLSIGGYCHIAMEPSAQMRWQGKPYDEEIRILDGGGTFDVDRNVGEFKVITDCGVVKVKGTTFTVRVSDEGESGMNLKKMFVKVLAGAVVITGSWGMDNLATGQEKEYVKSEDPPAERTPGKDGEKNAIAKGTVVGTVEEKGESWLRVKSLSGKSEKYIPEWEGGMPVNGGGPKKSVVRQIAKVHAGDKVTVKWYVNDHLRLSKVTVLESGKGDKEESEAGMCGFSGKVRGIVIEGFNGEHMLFKVGRILQTWKGNKAQNPKVMIGKTVKVIAGNERQKQFVTLIKKGEEMNLELRHDKEDVFVILELSNDQRERVAKVRENSIVKKSSKAGVKQNIEWLNSWRKVEIEVDFINGKSLKQALDYMNDKAKIGIITYADNVDQDKIINFKMVGVDGQVVNKASVETILRWFKMFEKVEWRWENRGEIIIKSTIPGLRIKPGNYGRGAVTDGKDNDKNEF